MKVRFYIAAHDIVAAQRAARTLERADLECTARWIHAMNTWGRKLRDNERMQIALDDVADVRRAHIFVVLASPDNVPGGKHIETGIALALGKDVFLVGRRENIFHWHPRVWQFATVRELASFLGPSNAT